MSAHPLRPIDLASTPREIVVRATRGKPLAVALAGSAVLFVVSLLMLQVSAPAPAEPATVGPAGSLLLPQDPPSTAIRAGVLTPRASRPSDPVVPVSAGQLDRPAPPPTALSSSPPLTSGAPLAADIVASASAAAAVPEAAASGAASATAALLDEAIAKAQLQRYYTAVNERDYQAAYDLVTSKWRQRQGYADFAAGYAGTKHDTLTVLAAGPASQASTAGYVLTVDVVAETTSGRTQHFSGLYFVIVEGGQPKIDSGRLTPVSP